MTGARAGTEVLTAPAVKELKLLPIALLAFLNPQFLLSACPVAIHDSCFLDARSWCVINSQLNALARFRRRMCLCTDFTAKEADNRRTQIEE